MATTEHTINDALAGVLRGTRRAWQQSNVVRSENTGMLKGSNERPDILVIESTVSPVVSELEDASDIEMALYTGSDLSAPTRWPRSGWIFGVSLISQFLCSAINISPCPDKSGFKATGAK